MLAQNPHPDGVEGAKPNSVHRAPHQIAHAVVHFARRAVGEGHRKDFPRLGQTEVQNVRNSGNQNPGFSSPGASQDQHRTIGGHHRFGLAFVEGLQIGRFGGRCGSHGARGNTTRLHGRRRIVKGNVIKIEWVGHRSGHSYHRASAPHRFAQHPRAGRHPRRVRLPEPAAGLGCRPSARSCGARCQSPSGSLDHSPPAGCLRCGVP